jgi:AAA domain/PLD-like domain
MFKASTAQFLSLQQMLSNMDIALDVEIKAQEVGSTSTKHVAVDGRFLEEQAGLYLYQFSLLDPWDVNDDSPTRIQVNNNSSRNATIVSSKGMSITIATKNQLAPEMLQQIILFDDSVELLKRLREFLKSNQENQSKLGSKTFGIEPFLRGSLPFSLSSVIFKPDVSQAQAMQMALGSEVTYIVGPPGTGKTVTLAAIALSHLLAGRTVLIAAHTNIAVDNAILKLADLSKKAGPLSKLREGAALRFGVPEHPDLRKPEYEDIYLPAIAKRRSVGLQQTRDTLETNLKSIEARFYIFAQENKRKREEWHNKRQLRTARLDPDKKELVEWQASEEQRLSALNAEKWQIEERYKQANQQLDAIKQYLDQVNADYVRAQSEYERLLSQRFDFVGQLRSAQQLNRIVRLVKGINQAALEKKLSEVNYQIWSAQEAQTKMQRDIELAHAHRAALEGQIRQLIDRLQYLVSQINTPSNHVPRIATLQRAVANLEYTIAQDGALQRAEERIARQDESTYQSTIADIHKRLEGVDAELREVEKRIVEEAQAIATTLSKTYMNSMLSERRFDVVIVDEVSMAPLPTAYVAASHANSSVVLIGDPQQLAPIAQAKDKNELVKKWLGTDLFHQRGITLELSSKGYENSALLEYQSRMHPEISKIARRHIYCGLIKDTKREERGDYSQVLPLPKKHLILCDTSDASPVAVRPESSRINVYHALCSVAIARQALSTLPGDGTQQGRQRIGIVTPYKKQSKLLQSLINDADLKEQVRVGTVHKFQGLEFDIVIFDTVESPDIPPRKDFIAGGKATEALRLINVAVTRARHKLIILANAQHILSAHFSDQSLWFPEESILRKAVEEARQAGTINSLDLLNLSIQAPNRASGHLSHSSVEVQFPLASRPEQSEYEHLDDRTFFDRLIQDMKLAQKKIVIFSPFFGPQRLEHIKPVLVERHRLGVEVVVFSSNIKQEPYYTRAIEELKQGGIKHQTFYGRHDKHAIIDTEIVYIGSLNMLSHFGTIEYMLRIKSPRFVESLCKFIDLETMETAPTKWGKDIEIPIGSLPNLPCAKCSRPLKPIPGKYGVFYGHGRNAQCNHAEDVPESIFRKILELSTTRCEKCRGQTKLYVSRKNAWMSCAASDPCNFGRKIVIL